MRIFRNPTSLEDGDVMSFTVMFDGVEAMSLYIQDILKEYGTQIKDQIVKEIHDDVITKIKDELVMEIMASISKEAITNMATITLAKSIGEEVAKGLVK